MPEDDSPVIAQPPAPTDEAAQPDATNKGGRPSKFSVERTNLILSCLRAGSSKDGAAAAASIDPKTLSNWEKEHPEFRESVRLAIEGSEATLAAIIFRAAQGTKDNPGDWRAAAHILACRVPERWSKRVHLEHGGSMAVTSEDEQMLKKVYGEKNGAQ